MRQRSGSGWRGIEHGGSDVQNEADQFILMRDLGLADQGLEEGDLFFSHLAARIGVRERHGTGHAAAFEKYGNGEGVFQGIRLRVKRDSEVIAFGLAGQCYGLNAAGELFELRRITEAIVEAGGKMLGARDTEDRRARDAVYARLHGGIATG